MVLIIENLGWRSVAVVTNRKEGVVTDRIGDVQICIRVSDQEVVSVTDEQGESVQHLFAYWFAWQAFHPQTDVYR